MSNNSSHTLECVARITDFSGRNILVGSKIPITINPVAQTAAYDAEPADAGITCWKSRVQKCTQAAVSIPLHTPATEHGYIIGLH